MDLLNKAFAQLNDLFRSMTPSGRITAAVLLVVALVCAAYLIQHQPGDGDDYLFGGAIMQTPTLLKMEEAFGTKGLNGFAMDGGRVKVPHAQRAAYLAALAESGALPPNFGQAFKEATASGLIDLPETIKRKEKNALQEEMSLVIGHMKGIEWASVIIDSQPQGGFAPPLKTASVAVQAVKGGPLDEEQVRSIRYYVAAVGMKPENVTIADLNGRVHPGAEADHGDGNPYLRAAQREEEQFLSAKVREALSYIPNLTVTATVTLVPALSPAGVANRSDAGAATPPAVKNSFTIKLAKVSLAIPASHYEKVWRSSNVPQEGREARGPDAAAIDKIREKVTQDVRNTVAAMLPPLPEVRDPASLVTVTTYQDFKAESSATPPVQRALTWLGQNWLLLAVIGLGLASIGMLRPLFRGNGPAEAEAAGTRASAPHFRPRASQEPVAAAPSGRTQTAGVSLQDELSARVKEDLNSAADILKSWIGHP